MATHQLPENIVSNGTHASFSVDGPAQLSQRSSQDDENVGDDLPLLDDFDFYMQEINNRLTISRMVSDSVIKGMVGAVSQEAAEMVAAKEIELAGLKESLWPHLLGGKLNDTKAEERRLYLGVSDAFVEPDSLRESMSNLSRAAKEPLEKLIRYVHDIKRMGAGIQGFDRQVDLDGLIYGLKATVDEVCHQAGTIAYSSNAFLKDLELEQEFRGDIESTVIRVAIQNLQEEYGRRTSDQNNIIGCRSKLDEISSLRQQLDALRKSLSGSEVGHLSSQGSLEMGHFPRKVLNSHLSSASSPLEGSGRLDLQSTLPENFESSRLKHMTKENLCNHFRTEMIKMKREHESKVQQMTEDYFSLMRDYLKEKGEPMKERGSFHPLKKDKDLDMLKKKIPEVISRLDDIVENENWSKLCNCSRERLEMLLSENCHLRDLLSEKRKKVTYLSSQTLDTTEILSRGSLAEENVYILVDDLQISAYEAYMEALVGQEVHKCVLKELADQIKRDKEDLDLKSVMMAEENAYKSVDNLKISAYEAYMETSVGQEVHKCILKELVDQIKCDKEGLDLKSVMMQEIFGIIFEEIVHDVAAATNFEENPKLREEVLALEATIKGKDEILQEVRVALQREKEQFEGASERLKELMDCKLQQESLIADRSKEIEILATKLEESLGQIDLFQVGVKSLTETLELTESNLKKSDDEWSRLIEVLQQERNCSEEKEKEHKKQMDSIIGLIEGLSKALVDFELRATEKFEWHNSRLESSNFELGSLIQKANVLRRTGLFYKQRLERRTSDLQKAEAEVDLLGDKVDELLSLLEKIYFALDHYSPILKHYLGIIEILKLVKRELK